MWLCTKFGFFSAVCARKGDGKKHRPVDPDRIMVRARDRKHLELLQEKFPELRPFEIHESAASDYRFRLFCPKGTWAHVACQLALDVDYDNFKSEVKRFGRSGAKYESALHSVWSTMYGVQTSRYGAGICSRPSTVLADYGITADDPDLRRDPPILDPEPFAGGTPDDGENVLEVFEQESGECVGVIWWPNLFDSHEQAYEKAVEVEALRPVLHPEIVLCRWEKVRDHGAPVFDVFDYGSLESDADGNEELLLPFQDIPVIRLVD